jgi:lipopolysaccharide/colanic/teichoic acid biosynthesis glycosyltransferase
MKRLLDVTLSAAALAAFLPLGIVICILLRFTGEGEVFYRQQRVGQGGRLFGLIKFATMLKDSPNIGTGLLTTRNDPRVLPLGRILRKTKLNEVPQLLNVLKGDMSLIGPRPQAPGHFALFPAHAQRELVKVKPGLSGIGSIVFRDEETIMARSPKPAMRCYAEDIAPRKGELEIQYIRNQSLMLDLKLIVMTLRAVLQPSSVDWERWWAGVVGGNCLGTEGIKKDD